MSREHQKVVEGAASAVDAHAEFADSEQLAARLENLLDVVTAIAELDFSRRAQIHGDGVFLDGLAYGLNVLSEELRASTVSRDYYDGIIRSMAEGLLVLDATETISDANPALCVLLGRSREQLVGRAWSEICLRPRAQLREGPRPDPTGLRRPSSEPHVETEFIREDGTRVEVALSGSILRSPNEADRWMYVVQDITAHKELARNLARARDAALHSAEVTASFLANMSHEIRTPLNGVIGMAWLLLDRSADEGETDPATHAKIEAIHDSATLLLDIVNDILDLSKLESGNAELTLEEFELAPAVENLLHVYALRAETKGLELVLDMKPGLPQAVRGDVGRLRQVLGNLISNAIKFTDHGEVVVEMGAAEDGGLRVAVRDTGIGIPEHLRATIFEAFRQAEATTERKYGGTGLGLAICRRLVALMGGLIGCDSRVGEGSTFWFEVPIEAVEAETEREPVAFLGGRAVLIVDDNPRQGRALAQTIEQWGGCPQVALTDAEAIAWLEDADSVPPLALVDWARNDGDVELLARLAERSGRAARVVLLTSLSAKPAVADLQDLGVLGGLPKPVKLSRLQRLLRRHVHGVSSPSEPPRAAGPRSTSELSLLVVEDNRINQVVVQGQLRRLGLAARVVSNGREAVEAVAEHRFSMVLMDLHMPVMDGYEATERIRGHAYGRDLPIVAVTANATEQVRTRCFSVGMDDFLSKPLRIEQLSGCLSRWLPGGVEVVEPGSSGPPADLPRATSVVLDQDGTPPSSDPRPEAWFRRDARVLVVDDNPVNRRVLLAMLRRLRVEADAAHGGREAIDAVAQRDYCAVLMDVEMPGIDGPTATRMIHEADLRRRIPVIAVTAHDEDEERARCRAAGMDDFLTKPIAVRELIKRLALWIGPDRGPRGGPVAGDFSGDSIGLDPLKPMAEALHLPEVLTEAREHFVRAGRASVERLRGDFNPGGWGSDVLALVTGAASLGAARIAGLAATVDRVDGEARACLLEVLDREIAALAH